MRFTLPIAVDWQVIRNGAILMMIAMLLRLDIHKQWPLLLEAGLYVGLLAVLASHPRLRELLTTLPARQRRGLMAFLGLLVFVQLWGEPQKTFPLVRWNMFTDSISRVPEFFEYTGICADGREVPILVHRVFRSQKRRTNLKLRLLWEAMCVSPDHPRREQAAREYVSLLTSVVRRFNELHPRYRVQAVRVTECSMSRPSSGVALNVARRPVREFAIESETF